MDNCNCDCHKKNTKTDLKKCQENSKRKTKEINLLKKKLMVATVVIAVGGTLFGKQTIDKLVEYFQAYDKVKLAIDKSVSLQNEQIKNSYDNGFAGVSILPAPSVISLFALTALMPTPRRR
mgnify:CR=1 FL=1|tara:strand:+ start:10394 stop:10756 length:363 start_codon:yes stop_codon:yes gene_type:complete